MFVFVKGLAQGVSGREYHVDNSIEIIQNVVKLHKKFVDFYYYMHKVNCDQAKVKAWIPQQDY